jgi:ubiquinone/menaquinone biosynthesis C-methylase UbiE
VGVSKADVYAAYQLILGRDASEEEAELWLGLPSLAELRDVFLSSPEFRATLGHDETRWRRPPNDSPSLFDTSPPLAVEWRTDSETEARLLTYVQETWTKLGKEEPHWSVLSSNQFKSSQIQDHKDEFYRSGSNDAALVRATVSRCGSPLTKYRRIMEFGCGVGRVTPYLAQSFDEVVAVDISTSHIIMARQRSEEYGVDNVRFVEARAPDFGMEPNSFDLWFSHIVLQHNPPPIIALILAQMFKQLKPGGLTIFQVPTYAPSYSFDLQDYLSRSKLGAIEVHCVPQSVVFELAQAAGCVPVEVREDEAMSYPWISNTFVFRKPR